jgi:hypothetical protein
MLSLLLTVAYAQDCNAKELKKELAESSPASVGASFKALADCDAKVAKTRVKASFERVLPGDDGNTLLIAAIDLGETEQARAWVTDLQSDERSGTIKALGEACDDSETLGPFLAETAEVLGDSFWNERWYRSLAECHDEGVQALLTHEVTNPSDNRTRFFGVLEVYSTNLGAAAIPTLEGLLTTTTSEEELTYVVNAFADAAHVGHIDGQDPEVTKLAVAAIVKAAPTLPTKAVEQARTTLTSLGAEDEADKLAVVRYADVADGGQLTYGLVVLETPAGCKKDAVWLGVHTGTVSTTLWPDQAHAGIEGAVSAWEYPLAKKCKGTEGHEVILSPGPLGADELNAWFEEQQKDLLKRPSDKRIDTVEETAISL